MDGAGRLRLVFTAGGAPVVRAAVVHNHLVVLSIVGPCVQTLMLAVHLHLFGALAARVTVVVMPLVAHTAPRVQVLDRAHIYFRGEPRLVVGWHHTNRLVMGVLARL